MVEVLGVDPGNRSVQSLVIQNFELLDSWWREDSSTLGWDCFFVIPPWLEVWWQELASSGSMYLYAVKEGDHLIGFAPLLVEGESASFMGSSDVSDCLDIVTAPGREGLFCHFLVRDLERAGISQLELGYLRPDSRVMTQLLDLFKQNGYKVSCRKEDVSLEVMLPTTWEGYLKGLSRKHRHEVRRKLRRLKEYGEAAYRALENKQAVSEGLDCFLELFKKSSPEKEQFLTHRRESFFKTMAGRMAREGLFRIGLLELDGRVAAAVIYFDYRGTVYLYNSGYDPEYGFLSVGLMCKILCIKDSIEKGRNKFDFLKGAEAYKYRLGGEEVSLHECRIHR